ncbi:hypothetical protein BH11MYX1_BH11MYX1_38970 [soil metagenome]
MAMAVGSAEAAPSKAHRQICGRGDLTARAIRVGNGFSKFEYYSIGAPARVDCAKMPRKSNLPANLKAAVSDSYKGLIGVWIFNGYATGVDRADLHTYKYADISFWSDELDAPTRDDNHAPEVSAFPASAHPEDEKAIVAGIKAKPGDSFHDKEVRKVSVIGDWQDSGKRGGVYWQKANVIVGVYDAENAKCWIWNKISVVRPESGGKPELDNVGIGVNEIDCKNLK